MSEANNSTFILFSPHFLFSIPELREICLITFYGFHSIWYH